MTEETKDILLQYGTGEEYLVSYKEGGLSMSEPVTEYPFTAITEIYQAGKTYGEKAIEAVKNVVAYPYQLVTEALAKEEPTGVIKSEDSITAFVKALIKPPWIFVVLGIAGLWVFGIFKREKR